jgi:membrane protein DedA with SNARE-associated domain
MIEHLILFIQTHLLPLGGLGVFIASVIEEVLAPIPSAFVIFASGFLLVDGSVTLHSLLRLVGVVAVPAALGIVLGSFFVYGVAYYAGKPVLTRWGKWLGLSWDDVEKIQRRFAETPFDEVSLFAVRAFPFIPSVVISAFCGLIRFPVRSYALFSFLGLVVRASVLGFVGWQIGTLYSRYAKFVTLFENVIFILIGISVLMFIGWRIYKHKKQVPIDPVL